MMFADRQSAGQQLAEELQEYADGRNTVVLGIPRGGIPVAAQIALRLRLPLDVFLSRKLGVPGQEELGFGAITEDGFRYLDQNVMRAAGITDAEVTRVTERAVQILRERAARYRGNQPLLDLTGKTVLLVDDGIATGVSVYAAIRALQQKRPSAIVLAVPVMPASTRLWLRRSVDKLVCLSAPVQFRAVGEFYRNFNQVSEEEVLKLLAECRARKMHSEVLPSWL